MQGQAICSNYSMYGICKYGPACKFDHPVVYTQDYSLSLPNLAMLDSSLFNYPRGVSIAHSSETSPSKSSKFPDWVQKHDAASNKHDKSDTKISEDSSERASSSPNSIQASTEPLHDHSG